jgi:hypothetical protein
MPTICEQPHQANGCLARRQHRPDARALSAARAWQRHRHVLCRGPAALGTNQPCGTWPPTPPAPHQLQRAGTSALQHSTRGGKHARRRRAPPAQRCPRPVVEMARRARPLRAGALPRYHSSPSGAAASRTPISAAHAAPSAHPLATRWRSVPSSAGVSSQMRMRASVTFALGWPRDVDVQRLQAARVSSCRWHKLVP